MLYWILYLVSLSVARDVTEDEMESDALPAVGNDDDSHPLHIYDNSRAELQNNRIPSPYGRSPSEQVSRIRRNLTYIPETEPRNSRIPLAYGIPLSEGVQHMTRNMIWMSNDTRRSQGSRGRMTDPLLTQDEEDELDVELEWLRGFPLDMEPIN